MKQHRAALALAVGVAGLAVGLASGLAGLPWLGLVAGWTSLVVAVLAYWLAMDAEKLRAENAALDRQVVELERVAAEQIQARLDDATRPARRSTDPVMAQGLGSAGQLTDPLTGLFSDEFFLVTMGSRINAARRHLRPVSVVILEVVSGLETGDPHPADPTRVAAHLQLTLRESDIACRLDSGAMFGLILEDTPESGAVWTMERIRRDLVNEDPSLSVWAGLACYPAHGFDSETVHEQCVAALAAAKEWRQGRIEVAPSA
jgi:diguanylate cyclase (GGDEF)-like protein